MVKVSFKTLRFTVLAQNLSSKERAASGHGRTKGPETEDFWAPIGHPRRALRDEKTHPNLFFLKVSTTNSFRQLAVFGPFVDRFALTASVRILTGRKNEHFEARLKQMERTAREKWTHGPIANHPDPSRHHPFKKLGSHDFYIY